MDYIANREPQILEMLQSIGIKSIEELFQVIPKEILLSPPNADDGLSEFEGIQHMNAIAKKNKAHLMESYLGGGAYEHHIPAIVQAICQKSEFLTSYTPYQAEASQGMLQVIFEFQSAICALTEMDISNASLYDGSSACAEAILMAARIQKKRKKILISHYLNPFYRKVIDLYLASQEIELITISDMNSIEEYLNEDVAAVLIQYPNFFGFIEDIKTIFKKSTAFGCINILCANPLVYALYKSASEVGADIAVGDCQPFGINLQFGGPYAGYIACKESFLRQLPGRIVGETVDTEGKRGFTLTMQAREQHIRREKATSNICSNQALCALASLVTMLWYGPEGLKKLALTNFQRSSYLKTNLEKINGITPFNTSPHFNEFTINLNTPIEPILTYFRKHSIEPGISTEIYFPEFENTLLICVTETKNKYQLDKYIQTMKDALKEV